MYPWKMGGLVVAPLIRAGKPKSALKEMLRGITPTNLHGETDYGRRVGKEIW
jgi:antitoxin component of MazEF toxin-antitoxin module